MSAQLSLHSRVMRLPSPKSPAGPVKPLLRYSLETRGFGTVSFRLLKKNTKLPSDEGEKGGCGSQLSELRFLASLWLRPRRTLHHLPPRYLQSPSGPVLRELPSRAGAVTIEFQFQSSEIQRGSAKSRFRPTRSLLSAGTGRSSQSHVALARLHLPFDITSMS